MIFNDTIKVDTNTLTMSVRLHSLCPRCLLRQAECDDCKANKARLLLALNTDLQALKRSLTDPVKPLEELKDINNKILFRTHSIRILCRMGFRYYEKIYGTTEVATALKSDQISTVASASGTSIPYDVVVAPIVAPRRPLVVNGCGKCSDWALCDNCVDKMAKISSVGN
jgi:hypothetical protein